MKEAMKIRIHFRVTDSEYANLQKAISKIKQKTGMTIDTSQAMRLALNSFVEENK